MAKPDLTKALIKSDGSVFQDSGRRLEETNVKGATSEELISVTLSEPTNVFVVPSFAIRDNLKIILDLKGTLNTSLGFNYSLRFNGDSGMNYLTGYPVGPSDRIFVGGSPVSASSGDTVSIFGSLTVTNRFDDQKFGNGYLSYIRSPSYMNITCPVFSWLPENTYITSLEAFVEDVNGVEQESFEFDTSSRIKVLGRNY